MRYSRSNSPLTGHGPAKWISATAAVCVAAAIAGIFVFATESGKQGDGDVAAEITTASVTPSALKAKVPDVGISGGFRLCNKTSNRVGVAIGYKNEQGWTTEGWWNMPTNACKTLLAGQLASRFYYVYAIDYDQGGEWRGRNYMCTDDTEFTIRNVDDCVQRGYEKTGFFEVDTGEQKSWTVQLTEPTQQGIGGR